LPHLTIITSETLAKMQRPPFARAAQDLREVFAHAPPQSVDLLSKMLRFSAGSRISMFDARNHKFHEDSTSSSSLEAAAVQVSSVHNEQVMLRMLSFDYGATCNARA